MRHVRSMKETVITTVNVKVTSCVEIIIATKHLHGHLPIVAQNVSTLYLITVIPQSGENDNFLKYDSTSTSYFCKPNYPEYKTGV